jgi:hypothetical protein
LAIAVLAGIREKLKYSDIPAPLQGLWYYLVKQKSASCHWPHVIWWYVDLSQTSLTSDGGAI